MQERREQNSLFLRVDIQLREVSRNTQDETLPEHIFQIKFFHNKAWAETENGGFDSSGRDLCPLTHAQVVIKTLFVVDTILLGFRLRRCAILSDVLHLERFLMRLPTTDSKKTASNAFVVGAQRLLFGTITLVGVGGRCESIMPHTVQHTEHELALLRGP